MRKTLHVLFGHINKHEICAQQLSRGWIRLVSIAWIFLACHDEGAFDILRKSRLQHSVIWHDVHVLPFLWKESFRSCCCHDPLWLDPRFKVDKLVQFHLVVDGLSG